MRLELEGNLPFVAVRVSYRGAEVVIRKVLIDMGAPDCQVARLPDCQ